MDFRHYAILDENNITINVIVFPINQEPNLEDILNEELEGHSLQEYSMDTSITNSPGAIGYIYDKNLNAFIPPKPEETYILDTETFDWHPNPDLVYDFNNDGVMVKAKYIKELKGWQLYEEDV